jgi:uncharacterized membrane protein YkvI
MRSKIAFQVAATYVGAVMGAGFASGQEIQQFFIRFGSWGLAGIVISSILFALLGWGIIELQENWKIKSYPDFINNLLGERLGRVIDHTVSVLLFVGMVAMISGSGALYHEYFALSRWIGVLLTSLVIILALWFRGEGVLWINSVLIPIKFIFCLAIATAAIFLAKSGDGEGILVLPNPLVKHWAFSAVLYVSYNLTLAMVVFASLGKDIQQNGARIGAIIGGLALGIFAFAIGISLLRFPDTLGMEIPMVAIAGKLGDWSAFLYVFVLWLAMVTAAIGNGFSFISRLVATGIIEYEKATILLLIVLIPLSGIKFSQIVEVIYPLFGYIGLVFVPVILYKWFKKC